MWCTITLHLFLCRKPNEFAIAITYFYVCQCFYGFVEDLQLEVAMVTQLGSTCLYLCAVVTQFLNDLKIKICHNSFISYLFVYVYVVQTIALILL